LCKRRCLHCEDRWTLSTYKGNSMILHSATLDLALSSTENNAQMLFYRHQWDFHSKTSLLNLTRNTSSDFLYNFFRNFFKLMKNSEKLSHICTGLYVQCLLHLSRLWQKLNSVERFKLKSTLWNSHISVQYKLSCCMWTALMTTNTLNRDYFAYFHFIMSYESISWEN